GLAVGIEKVPNAGNAKKAGVPGARVDTIQVDRRVLFVPSHTVIQSETGFHAPGILNVEAKLTLLVVDDRLVGAVGFSVRIQNDVLGNAGYATRQERVHGTRVAQVGRTGARKVGSGEKAGAACVDRVISSQSESDTRRELRI